MYWQDAKFGTIANVIIMLSIILSYGKWSFNTMVRNELKPFLPSVTFKKMAVTREEVASLPLVVQKWLKHSNVIGKEFTQTVHLKQKGEMRTAPDGKLMLFKAEQYFTTQKPGLIWLADVEAAPEIYLAARDKYEDGKGHMLIKLLTLFPVADAKGKEINQSAMVRYLAEIIWFPSASLNNYIRWEQVDSATVKATMTYGGATASGFFKFNENGDVVSFEAKRHYYRKDGSTLEDWFAQIEPQGYKEFKGVKIPTKVTATWKLKEGDFTWLNMEISEIHYNAAVSGRPKGESVLTAWFPARAERGQQAVAAYRRIPYRAKRGRERCASPAGEPSRVRRSQSGVCAYWVVPKNRFDHGLYGNYSLMWSRMCFCMTVRMVDCSTLMRRWPPLSKRTSLASGMVEAANSALW